MSRELVEKIARAVLYEGYVLYPYRPSVKTRQRWTFGGIYPQSWSDAQAGSDPWFQQTEILVSAANAPSGPLSPVLRGEGGGEGSGDESREQRTSSSHPSPPPSPLSTGERGPEPRPITLNVAVRFLHLIDRTVGEFAPPLPAWPSHGEPAFHSVETLQVGPKQFQSWQEAAERTVDLGEFTLRGLLAAPQHLPFSFPARRDLEPLKSATDEIVGVLIREQQAIEGVVEISAAPISPGLTRLTVKTLNLTPLPDAPNRSRDDALMRSLASTHAVLEVRGGEFISATDPPENCRAAVKECQNIGTWPVLIGAGGERDTILSSPIILPDYPEIAPESPGDLFDSTEIDEILTLRIMTLTDEEKQQAAGVDDRVRDLFARTESLAREQLMNLHGTMRGLHPVARESAAVPQTPPPMPAQTPTAMPGHAPVENAEDAPDARIEQWDPFAPKLGEGPRLDQVIVRGVRYKPGDAVRLKPLGRGDIFDVALDRKAATIVAIEQDYENRIHVAVTVDEDPGSDLGRDGKIGHRFFFGIDEIELIRPDPASPGEIDQHPLAQIVAHTGESP